VTREPGNGSIGRQSIKTQEGRRRNVIHGGEDIAVSLVLTAMMVLPLLEAVMRIPRAGISTVTLVQHLTLIVGMLGAAIAARENRLLAISTLGNKVPERWKTPVSIFSASWAAAIAFFFFGAGVQFVSSERSASKMLTAGIPVWWIQAIIPVGFAVIALRILRHSAERWKGRIVAASLTLLIVYIGIRPPVSPEKLIVPALAGLMIATLAGIPVFATLGGVAMIMFWGTGVPVAALSVDHYSLVTSAALPTMPLFTLAGYFLAAGRAPKRFLRVFQALFGWIGGGAAVVTVLLCAFFTSFTGASGTTIVAIGALLMPVLLAEKYSERSALGLVTGAGSLGVLFAPCLPLILYGVIARIPIEKMFLGGVIPGVVMSLATLLWGIHEGRKGGLPRRTFAMDEARSALWEAKWELMIPLVAFAGMFSGFATPVEAAALTATYALVTETVIYRDLSIKRDVPRAMAECGLLVGGILLILGVALGLTDYLVDSEITMHAVQWVTNSIHSRWLFLLALNLFLLAVGCLMDIYSAITIQVPLLIPIGAAYGVDPIHLGITFLATMELGYLTPPVGLNLYLSSMRFGKSVPEVFRSVIPIICVLYVGVLLITFLPWLTTALPRYFGN
jgi:C4-dicarboxylate transporter DctM subunit